ncbi:CDP-glycerol glycerophosphotransferase [Pullulanibacillus pueri]|uniref:Glycosyltransferase 2-like domain-containing protein n=1 Tax=Pullulanibacillus pueri TaxID=1437324 RepID=A0A8J3EL07_9BACL|nr:bifunctional glycosyltransferase/CDP-glycerol:glycerophosphate glycerophosphotransferase [Pullulanibacillus pueri]MBM7683633.1 CDP-glycerol glycerophosphotransferase [Pullulanibacillus pueri]GGH76632.1 hypothetical protein GCM10007096_07350 [Pullulanibacillus pueri]
MPKVSVIVPIYNVEQYLEECLDSLVNQTLDAEDLEVIMVNDGSMDGSPSIMENYSDSYPNFKSFHKENGGLGQARNFGVEKACGDYIVFLDSDDYVAPQAYELMVETALATGSDIVVGNVERFNSTKVYPSGLHKKIFRETVLKTHISRYNDLIYDTTAWNKLFRKAFWDQHHFKFPEGILYEDIPVTIPAHYLSTSTDILEDVVYFWRAREGNDQSITQKRHELRNFSDRLTVIKMVDRFFKDYQIDDSLYDLQRYKTLDVDLLMYLNQLDEVDSDYINVFFKETGKYLKKVPDHILNQLSAIDRLKYYLVKLNDQEKFFEVLSFQKKDLRHTKVLKRGQQYIGDYPFRKELPDHLFVMNEELRVVPKINSVNWQGTKLCVKGYNYIKNVDMKSKQKVRLDASLKNPETGKQVAIPVEKVKRPDVTHKRGVKLQRKPLKRLYNYHWSGYELVIDFKNEAIKKLGSGKLELWFRLDVDGLQREFRAGGPVPGRKPRPTYKTLLGQHLSVRYNKKWDFYIESVPLNSVITRIDLFERSLVIRGSTATPLEDIHLELYNYANKIVYPLSVYQNNDATELEFPNEQVHQFRSLVNLRELAQAAETGDWTCYVVCNNEYLPLTIMNNVSLRNVPLGEQEVRLKASSRGNLVIDFLPQTPKLLDIVWKDDSFNIELIFHETALASFSHIKMTQLALQHVESGKTFNFECKNETSRNPFKYYLFECSIRDSHHKAMFDVGKWDVYLEIEGLLENGSEELIKRRVFVEDTTISLPNHSFSGIKHIPYRTGKGNFSLKTILAWNWIERGPRRQEFTRRIMYHLFRLLPMNSKSVVLESYWGKSATCNPRAIVDYMEKQGLNYKYIWSLNNENKSVNPQGIAVRKNSLKYYYYLATSKYFINNANFPDFYKKRKRAIEIQTLHGTFLKTMGLDVPGENDTEEKRERFLRRCARWDYLLSPSRYMSEITRRCYLYENEILEVGFPRNDVLYNQNNQQQIENLKAKLNLPKDKKVILYAPTWRVKNKFNIQLDIEKMQNELGEDYILLLRLHYFVANGIDLSPYKGFAYNMSAYEDIQELYLISDLLITDYSSVMFDYANLNRPILFFTYDLEHYRDQLRGFYIDLEAEAPGPLVKTNEALIHAVQHVDDYRDLYGEKMAKFRSKYCQFDNGTASKQVVEKVFKKTKII